MCWFCDEKIKEIWNCKKIQILYQFCMRAGENQVNATRAGIWGGWFLLLSYNHKKEGVTGISKPVYEKKKILKKSYWLLQVWIYRENKDILWQKAKRKIKNGFFDLYFF